jgi:hypothetical protein
LSAKKEKSKIKSGQGSQREARYPDELVDWLSAARRTPTPTPLKMYIVRVQQSYRKKRLQFSQDIVIVTVTVQPNGYKRRGSSVKQSSHEVRQVKSSYQSLNISV